MLVADYLVTGFINQMMPFDRPNNEYIKAAYNILKDFGKEDLFNRKLDELSSGEKQIVMIARVLIQNPEIIIFDEPTANLDVKNQIVILNQIKELSKKGYTILITSHNPGHAYSMGGKTLILGKGKYCFGNTTEIITDKTLSEYYELDVTIHSVEGYNCMIFQNDDKDEVNLIL